MQEKSKYVRNLTIGAVTGGLILGGAFFVLNDRKPFIRDYIDSYKVTTDTTIGTTDGLVKLGQTTNYLTEDRLKDINGLEIKSYTQVEDNYDVEVYGFKNDSLTEEEIIRKKDLFEDGYSLSAIANYDNHDEYQVEAKELPADYKNVLEEINIKTVNYDSVIKVKESRETNIKETSFWILITACGALAGATCAKLIDSAIKDFKKLVKRR